MMNYEKLDLIFEGVQQQLYSKRKFYFRNNLDLESLYTSEWERRVFNIIGRFTINQNENIYSMFKMLKI
jgi:hypothetical protein